MVKFFRDPTERYSIIFLISTFVASITLHLIPDVRPLVLKLTELYLFLTNSLLFAFGLLNNHRKLSTFTFWSVLTMLCIFLIQYIGINTGDIFGLYWFNDTLATQVAGIPLIMILYWTMLILSAYGSLSRIIENRYIRAFLSSLILVFLDFLIEPVAMKLNYWSWENDLVPIQNYISWFFLCFVFSIFLAIFKIHGRSVVFQFYLLIQFLFYLILRIFL